MQTRRFPPIAAFVYRPDEDASSLLAQVAQLLRAKDVIVGGAVQHHDGPCQMSLEIFPSCRRLSISQPHAKAGSCKLDTSALAEAAALVRQAIDDKPQLAIFNKFGAQEAAGEGMRAEMAAAVVADVPLLTAVSEELLPQWTVFTGGNDVRLQCKPEAALEWWKSLHDRR
jgi:hypothetical protein